MSKTKDVDPSTKMTEEDFQNELDRFFLAATPKVYEWLRWVLTLAAITWAQKQTHSVALLILLTVAYVCSMWYFNAFFYQFAVQYRTHRRARIAAGLACALLAGGTWFLVKEAVSAVVLVHP